MTTPLVPDISPSAYHFRTWNAGIDYLAEPAANILKGIGNLDLTVIYKWTFQRGECHPDLRRWSS